MLRRQPRLGQGQSPRQDHIALPTANQRTVSPVSHPIQPYTPIGGITIRRMRAYCTLYAHSLMHIPQDQILSSVAVEVILDYSIQGNALHDNVHLIRIKLLPLLVCVLEHFLKTEAMRHVGNCRQHGEAICSRKLPDLIQTLPKEFEGLVNQKKACHLNLCVIHVNAPCV